MGVRGTRAHKRSMWTAPSGASQAHRTHERLSPGCAKWASVPYATYRRAPRASGPRMRFAYPGYANMGEFVRGSVATGVARIRPQAASGTHRCMSTVARASGATHGGADPPPRHRGRGADERQARGARSTPNAECRAPSRGRCLAATASGISGSGDPRDPGCAALIRATARDRATARVRPGSRRAACCGSRRGGRFPIAGAPLGPAARSSPRGPRSGCVPPPGRFR
jgi:hypothetical protein